MLRRWFTECRAFSADLVMPFHTLCIFKIPINFAVKFSIGARFKTIVQATSSPSRFGDGIAERKF